jgi:hypothetical protein
LLHSEDANLKAWEGNLMRALLLIADIGGYTKFMNANRMSLAHAQELVAKLLEAVLDSATSFELAKLEGDAAFLFKREPDAAIQIDSQIASIHAAFLQRKAELMAHRVCACEGCVQVEGLSIKFVAHEGEVALQRIKQHTELAGVDVIMVHRLLKNDVPLKEYALLTDAARPRLGPKTLGMLKPITHDLEGLGPTPTHFVDLATLDIPAAPKPSPSLRARVRQITSLSLGSFPYLLGLRKAASR